MSEKEAKKIGLKTPPPKEEEEEEETTTSLIIKPLKDTKETLVSLIGPEGYTTLENVAKSIGKPIFDTKDDEGNFLKGFVHMKEVEKELDAIEVLQGKSRQATNFVVYTINAKGDAQEITIPDIGLVDAGAGYEGYDITTLYDNTVFKEANALQIGEQLSEVFKSKLALGDIENTQREHEKKLKQIQGAMNILGNVFGFDDQEHLEMFTAAWLMKDSTCRLSGIPGTGKTTVIEAASILLCNSYGFDTHERYISPLGREITDLDVLFGDDRNYVPDLYKQGQLYDLSYSNNDYRSVYNGWDDWRFTDWNSPTTKDSAGNVKPTSTRSGAYLYGFSFLQMLGTDSDENEFKKRSMEPSDFSKLLTNCWIATVPKEGFRHPKKRVKVKGTEEKTEEEDDYVGGPDLIKLLPEEQLTTIVAPIRLMDENGKYAINDEPLSAIVSCDNLMQTNPDGTKEPMKFAFEMRLKYPECRFGAKDRELDYGHILTLPESWKGENQAHEFIEKGYGLFTDAGRSEGYGLRKFLETYYYDGRLTESGSDERGIGLKKILEEMLEENGVAKIDYEKRADEVLYGIEIQQATYDDPVRDKTISTYEFEPVPRPIVTQPVKFFNEANRSQAGVEDAILGLIAERKVEYRGKTFNSPHFVAWMDTNPHQKGNDLAFIDRIDMELLFKSISLGSRYTVLDGTYGKGKGFSPQIQVVDKLAIDKLVPLRFRDLNSIWSFVGDNSKIGYVPPGQNPGSATYDALREISYISVLFTQKWDIKNYSLKSAESFKISEVQSLKSPLLDYSTTTNTNPDGTPNVKPESRPFEQQPPAQFERVLGFRFTNSLVKLSSALAFLRGRSYVTRSEILDGLPYVTAHRLGRAKTAADESRGLPKDLQYENEQQWIREAIVNGYLLSMNDTAYTKSGRGGQKVPLMDIWDLYYRRCVDNLQSSPTLFWYEAQVIAPLRVALGGGIGPAGSTRAGEFTPVHWHIATMVMENERTATKDSSTKPHRSYKHGDDYIENYDYYRNRIFSKPTPGKDSVNLYDYFKLRGDIAQEPNLFSDDRETLLEYLESRMATIAGGDSKKGDVSNPIAATTEKHQALKAKTMKEFGLTMSPTTFPWRTYQDSIGAWGHLLMLDGWSGTGLENQNFADNEQTVVTAASSFTDQAMMISGRMECRKPPAKRTGKSLPTHSTLAKNKMLTQIENLRLSFASSVLGEGVMITKAAEGDFKEYTMEEFLDLAKLLVSQYPEQKEPENKFIIRTTQPDGDEIYAVETAVSGLLGCFPLKHAGGAPSADPMYSGDDDFLRLWIRVFRSELSKSLDESEGSSKRHMATLNLTMGITSNFASKDNKMLSMTGPFEDVDIGTVKNPNKIGTSPYLMANFTEDNLIDTGNLSLTDILQYQVVFDNAVNK